MDVISQTIAILIGASFTLMGIWFTEFIKKYRKKKKLTNALYLEVLFNIMANHLNLKLLKFKPRKRRFFVFHTIAFEQFKLGVFVDEGTNKKLLENLFRGYSLIEWFNKNIEKYETEKSPSMEDYENLFQKIEEYMQNIRNDLST